MRIYNYQSQNELSVKDTISRKYPRKNPGTLKQIFSLLDLTSLRTDDTAAKVRSMCEKLNHFPDQFLEGDLDHVACEIRQMKQAVDPAKLKVILETGLLPDPVSIYRASMISMESGADFIKTSTGKIQPAATLEAVLVMCHAIRDFLKQTGHRVGIKPAGGISTAAQALEYTALISGALGEEWLDPALFRIGASRLANHLLSEIATLESGQPREITYF